MGMSGGPSRRHLQLSAATILRVTSLTLFISAANNTAISQASSSAVTSTFTSLSHPACITTSVKTQGAESVQVCPGIAGYKLLLLDSDGRMSLTLRGKNSQGRAARFLGYSHDAFFNVGQDG